MTNDELKALYKRYPWAWEVQRQCRHTTSAWGTDHCSTFGRGSNWRLKPNLPADLPEPTEDMMNRAVYLGYGRDCRTVRRARFVSGWKNEPDWQHWQFGSWCFMKADAHYCIDVTDLNADEIIALNRAEAKKPFDLEVETHPVAEMLQSVLGDRIQYLLSIDAQSIRDALIELGWTPPGESQWLRLDECEIQTADGFGGWDQLIPLRGERHLMALVYSIAKDGPASVRVRKRQ